MAITTRSIALVLICLLAGDGASANPNLKCPPGHKIDWVRVPSAGDMSEYYPRRTDVHPVGGLVTLACTVNDAGQLTGCKVASETPPGLELGDAALRLARLFRVARPGYPLPGHPVRVPIRFVAAPD